MAGEGPSQVGTQRRAGERGSHWLIAREEELLAGERFLDRVRAGGALLHLEGEAGIGKTALWAELARAADERGYAVLSCRASTAESSLAYVSFSDLVGGVADSLLDRLPPPQRNALEAALLRSHPAAPGLDRRAVATAFVTLLGLLAESGPVVVAVDDASRLDRPSARVLEFAVRRLGPRPLGILATSRTDEGRPRLVAMFPGEAEHIVLGPLSLGSVYRLLKSRLGLALPRPALLKVEAASGGNPLFALEIARVLQSQGLPGPGEPLPVPDSLAQLVAGRIDGLPAETREAVLAASASVRPTTDLVDPLSLEPAEEAGVLTIRDGRIEFSHPLFAAAAYAAATPTRRRRLHAELASLATDLEERARHLMRASEGPDEQMASVLAEAAERAAAHGAPETAAELEEEAARRTPDARPETRWERLLRAASYNIQSGDGERARQLAGEVRTARPPPSIHARALHLIAETHYRDRPAESVHLLEEAVAHASEDGSPTLEVEILMSLAFASQAIGSEPDLDRHLHRMRELAALVEERGALAEVLAWLEGASFFTGRGFDELALERALALEDPDRRVPVQMRPVWNAALIYAHAGRLDRAEALLTGLRDRVLQRGEESDLPYVLAQLGAIRVFAGDPEEAGRRADAAINAAALVDSEVMRGYALAVRAHARAQAGDALAARTDATEALTICERAGWPHGICTARWALGFLAVSEGEPELAWSTLEPVVAAIEELGYYDFATAMYIPDGIEALVGIGELDRARSLTDSLQACGARLDRAWALAAAARCRSLIEAARGNPAEALLTIDAALAQHERVPMPLERARSLLVKGTVLRRLRRRRAARTVLQEAVGAFDELGARIWAERAGSELARTGLGRRDRDELTETERRVAELAASGLTNKQVAAQAFLTPKSVEDVLARVYRKLGIHSRAELGARMGPAPRTGPGASV
jgi:DNA-binding CsgD family transcriptional regulator